MTKEEIIQKGEKKFPPDIIEEIGEDGSIVQTDVNATVRRAYVQGLIDNNCQLPSDIDEAAEEYYDEMWDDLGGVAMVRNNEHDIWYPSEVIETVFKAGAEWMAGQFKTLGETEIYLEDDGGEEPYIQEWLDLNTTEFAIPEGFKPGDKVIIQIRKK